MNEWAIRTGGLTKQYRGVSVVEGIDLAVAPRQVFGFLGPNGAGKSTTMKMLLGLAAPSAGTVEVLGERFTPATAKRVLPRIGSLIEAPSFYGHLTGRENLDIVRRIKNVPVSLVDEVLETVRLTHAAGKRAKEYSLGMKQRLGIAMALLGDPELLIRAIHNGDAVVTPRITRRMLDASRWSPAPPALTADFASLTPREFEVACAIVDGLTNDEIAERFFLTNSTVKAHINRILRKMDARDRVEVVVRGYRAGLAAS